MMEGLRAGLLINRAGLDIAEMNPQDSDALRNAKADTRLSIMSFSVKPIPV